MLASLGAAFPAPIVVAQHLDPRVPSHLAAILGKRTPLRVVAVDGREELTSGTVYVVPSDRQVRISDQHVEVRSDSRVGGPKPSIDLLFASAAEVYGDRLIAVVLTGLGSDGTEGARAVKRNGGTVIIEDPRTASFPSMPASLAPAMVDIVAPVAQIGAELMRLTGEHLSVADDLPALRNLLERIHSQSGIDFSHYKMPTIKRRLARRLTTSGCTTLEEYLAFLDEHPGEYQELVGNFLIKVTRFFRDRDIFSALRTSVIPELIEHARAHDNELRLWSAGCATGEEAYSLAILVAEALKGQPVHFTVRIFATDVDETAISFARHGVYPLDALEGMEPEWIERYFLPVEGGYEVAKSIRDMTVFGQHDLGQRAPFPRIDLTLCRNVLIYFSRELQQRTLQIFAFSLRNGGYLALGKAETTNPLAEYFEVVDPAVRIFRRYGARVMIPPAQTQKPLYQLREGDRVRRRTASPQSAQRDGRATMYEKLGSFLTNSAIGVVLVDRRYDILSINTAARHMLNIHGIAVGDDLIHLLPPASSSKLRAALDAALRNEEPVVGGEEIELTDEGDGAEDARYLTISTYPERADDGNVAGAALLVVDVTEIAQRRWQSEKKFAEQRLDMDRLRAAEMQARDRQRSLLDANRQLATANSELRAQNDSLIISAEEAEAATEEIETLNEEMQATNEELETLNEEFQATIEELNTTNDEHEARSIELGETLEKREAQQHEAETAARSLGAIVDELPSAMAAVDALGSIVAANALFRELQAAATDSSVQIDDDTGATIPLGALLRRAADGATFGFTYRIIATDQSRTTYAGHVRPAAPGSATVAVITLEPKPR